MGRLRGVLQKLGQERQQNRGDETRNGQRQAADSTGQFAHFRRLGGADDMGGGAEGHTLGNGVGQPEEPEQRYTQYIGDDSGENDGGGSDGGNTRLCGLARLPKSNRKRL